MSYGIGSQLRNLFDIIFYYVKVSGILGLMESKVGNSDFNISIML